MKRPTLKEYSLTDEKFSKYQDYKTKNEEKKNRIKKFDNRFYESLISIISMILLLFIVARDVLFKTVSRTFNNGEYGNTFFLILATVILSTVLFFLIRMIIGTVFIYIFEPLKIHQPFKKLYIKTQPTNAQEAYFDNAKEYELHHYIYCNYIKNLQTKFPDIIKFNNDLQKFFKKIISEIIKNEHLRINSLTIKRKQEKQKEYWLKMDGIKFEHEVSDIYRGLGYKVKTRKASGDGGVDIELRKSGNYSIVQCKNQRSKAGEPVVRDLLGTMHKEKASNAILICTGGFSSNASSFAKGQSIELIDLNQFMNLVNDVYPQEYKLVNTVSETLVRNSNRIYKFKVLGKVYILYSCHSVSKEETYCLFETREDAEKKTSLLKSIGSVSVLNSVIFEIGEWFLINSSSYYNSSVLYYIKIVQKERKITKVYKNKKDKEYVQKEIWGTKECVQKKIWTAK